MSGGDDLGLSPAELVVIRDLLAHPSSTITEIASRTGFVHSRISTAVSSLRERGWVATCTDAADRRRTVATVTDLVRHGLGEVRARGARPVLAEVLRDFTPERRAELIASLEAIARALAERGERPGRG
jgi:DNA-binding MarR family transcriptional regulator